MATESKKNYTVPAQRQELILQHIKANGSGTIRDLAERVGASEATIRRDLDELDRMGKIERTHGGAVAHRFDVSFERQHEEKMNLMQDEKQQIAMKAAGYIREGDTIFIDSGTTAFYLKSELKDIPNLTVFTYDLIVAQTLELHETSTLIVTGGVRRRGFNSVLSGSYVVEFLRNIRVDKVFLGADAVDISFGVSNSNFEEAEAKKQIIEIGSEIFLMADHTKFGNVAMARVCPLSAIDVLITDEGLDGKLKKALEKEIEYIDYV